VFLIRLARVRGAVFQNYSIATNMENVFELQQYLSFCIMLVKSGPKAVISVATVVNQVS